MAAKQPFLAPSKLVDAMRAAQDGATILAGGTDLLPRWSRGLVERPQAVVSLSKVSELQGISQADGQLEIGAHTLVSEIARDPLIRDAAPVLADAAGRIACPQVRNRATIGGNLCNASPAADTAIPLILLDAMLEIAWPKGDAIGRREVPITDFFRGPGETALLPGEILTKIRFRPFPKETFAAWDKFGTRPAMEIAVASVGVALLFKAGTIQHARIGYGSVAPVPLRGLKAEAVLEGTQLPDRAIARCEVVAKDEIAPISDVRAGDDYRREIVGVMLRRMLEDARDG
jgi:CO/xanthine dehydrogenase FAD-binding subunit